MSYDWLKEASLERHLQFPTFHRSNKPIIMAKKAMKKAAAEAPAPKKAMKAMKAKKA